MSAVLQARSELRPMLPTDLDAVMRIEEEIYEFPWTRGNFRDSLAAGYRCSMLLEAGQVLGYAVLIHAADEAHLLNLSIALSFQGRGFGGRLLESEMAAARDYGATQLFLEVRTSNIGAQRLYVKHGFDVIGMRRNYYPSRDGREDANVLSRKL